MRAESKPTRRVCSVTDALSILGGRYALLVAASCATARPAFREIAAGTGAPRDVLTARLRKLERSVGPRWGQVGHRAIRLVLRNHQR